MTMRGFTPLGAWIDEVHSPALPPKPLPTYPIFPPEVETETGRVIRDVVTGLSAKCREWEAEHPAAPGCRWEFSIAPDDTQVDLERLTATSTYSVTARLVEAS